MWYTLNALGASFFSLDFHLFAKHRLRRAVFPCFNMYLILNQMKQVYIPDSGHSPKKNTHRLFFGLQHWSQQALLECRVSCAGLYGFASVNKLRNYTRIRD